MKSITIRRFVYTCSIVLLATFLAACGSNPTTSTPATVSSSSSTSTQIPAQAFSSTSTQIPAQASSSTSTQTPAQASSSTSVSNTSTTFKQFVGADFTINYPASWQTSHKFQPGVNNWPPENIYGFVAQDNITGLHIVRNGDEQAVGGMVNQLLGGQFSCNIENNSVSSQVTVGGVTRPQSDLVCMIHNSNFEVRELVFSSPKYGQTVIMYGAYQQVGNGALAPDFAHASNMYFNPMLASFKFN